jgi:hypothetical protein
MGHAIAECGLRTANLGIRIHGLMDYSIIGNFEEKATDGNESN